MTLAALNSVALDVRVVLGRASVRVADVLGFAPGVVVPLDAAPDAPVALLVNGVAIAHGDIVVTQDGSLAVEIAALATPREQLS
ncbi:MAG TPA: FliM/FliN family flagellar motor C-terminal domain-containing protein [Candidatus Eremiobacteraceae bacterium]